MIVSFDARSFSHIVLFICPRNYWPHVNRWPVWDKILATCRQKIEREEYDSIIRNFNHYLSIMEEQGHIPDQYFDDCGVRMDKDVHGKVIVRSAMIAQESYQRSKCLSQRTKSFLTNNMLHGLVWNNPLIFVVYLKEYKEWDLNSVSKGPSSWQVSNEKACDEHLWLTRTEVTHSEAKQEECVYWFSCHSFRHFD